MQTWWRVTRQPSDARRPATSRLASPAWAAPTTEPSSLGDRFRAYRRALAEAGVAEDPRLVIRGSFGLAGGRAMAHDLLALEPRPTAAFAYSDLAAMGLVRGLDEAGVSVPEEVAVVGFGDTELATYTRPALTTVTVPAATMAAMGVDTFFALRDGDTTIPADRVVATPLVVRESCGARARGNQRQEPG